MYIKKADRKPLAKVIPPLPAGTIVGDKTPEVEMLRRSNSKWLVYARAIEALPSTKVLKIDVQGVNKGRINTIRQGIRKAWAALNIKGELRFSHDSNMGMLNVWMN